MLYIVAFAAHADTLDPADLERWAKALQPRIESVAGREFTRPVRTFVNDREQVARTLGISIPEHRLSGYHDGIVYILGDELIKSPGMQHDGALEPAAHCLLASAMAEGLLVQQLGEELREGPLQLAARLWLMEEVCGGDDGVGIGWYRGMTGTAGYSGTAFTRASDPLSSQLSYLRTYVASVASDEGPEAVWALVSSPLVYEQLRSGVADAVGPLLDRDYGRDVISPIKQLPPDPEPPGPFWLLEPVGLPGLSALARARSTRRFDLNWPSLSKDGATVSVVELDEPELLRRLMEARRETTGTYELVVRQQSFSGHGLEPDPDSAMEVFMTLWGGGLLSYTVSTRSIAPKHPAIREVVRVRKLAERSSPTLYELWIATETVLFVVRTVDHPAPTRGIEKAIATLVRE